MSSLTQWDEPLADPPPPPGTDKTRIWPGDDGNYYFQIADGSFTPFLTGVAASPLTTKGDLWGFSTVNARLTAGTNSTVLIADSAQTLGLRYGSDPTLAGATINISTLTGNTISTGTIDNTPIGNTTPSTVKGTRLLVGNTDGTGYIELPEQSAPPSTPTNAIRIYTDASNRFSWKGENGFVRTFDGTGNTADRVYVLPDASGTVALTSSLALYLPLTGGTLSGDVGNTSTGYLQVASGTTAQEPGSPANGMIRYNSTTARFEFYNAVWVNYPKLSGDTFTGTVSVGDGTTSATFRTNALAGQTSDMAFQTAGVNRILLRKTSTAESGSNAGSNWNMLMRDDTGAALGTPWSLIRSTGASNWIGYTDTVQHKFLESANQVSDLVQFTTSGSTVGVAIGPSTIASAAGAVWNRFRVPSQTLTLSGAVNVTTANGLNMVEFGIPTISTTVAITTSATVTILGAPTVTGGGSITNAYALLVAGGTARFLGAITAVNGLTSTGNSTWSDCSISVSRSLTTTSTDGVILTESSASTAVATVKISPRLRWSAQVWNTTGVGSNQVHNFKSELIPQSATTPTSYLGFAHDTGSGSYTDSLYLSSVFGLKLPTLGQGFYLKEGANGTMGVATLVTGTVVVATTKASATCRIFLTDAGGGTLANVGGLSYVLNAGVGFTINSANPLDNNNVNWIIFDQA